VLSKERHAVRLEKTFRFEAAHQIHNHPGKCKNLHGHSWVLTVTIEGKMNIETGMVLDFYEIKSTFDPLIETLDHSFLNNIIPWIPTSEMLLVWIAEQLPYEFPWYSLTVSETCTCQATLFKKEFLEVTYVEFSRKEEPGHEKRQDGEDGQEEATQEAEEVTNDDIPF
jgi:6-pyruvoyltetrahydropterin/6-carboxytetrahydropterin synthase